MADLALILGGARSGKSALALEAAQSFKDVLYYATAHRGTGDAELESRIDRHAAQRPSHWGTVEPPQGMAELKEQVQRRTPELVVLDCATLWLGWILSQSFSQYTRAQLALHLENESEFLIRSLRELPCPVLIVSNEAGSGVVPSAESGRLFRDALGALNTKLARVSQLVTFTIAGIPLVLKDRGARSAAVESAVPFVGAEIIDAKKLGHKLTLLVPGP